MGEVRTRLLIIGRGKKYHCRILQAIGTAFVIVASIHSICWASSLILFLQTAIYCYLPAGIIGDNYLMLTTLTLLSVALFPKYFESISGSRNSNIFYLHILCSNRCAYCINTAWLCKCTVNLVLQQLLCLLICWFHFNWTFIQSVNLEKYSGVKRGNINRTDNGSNNVSRGWTKLIGQSPIIGTLWLYYR